MNSKLILSAAVAACLVAPATAQIGSETLYIDATAQSGGNAQSLGVAYESLTQQIFSTARGSVGSTAAPHSIYVYDTAGNLLSTLPQSAASDLTTWGYRDGASSIVGQLFFGWDGGIDVYDAPGVAPTALTPSTSVIAANGPQPIPAGGINPNTINNVDIGGTHRAVAFDFFGNGGNGSFFIANFGSSVYEIAVDGTLLNTFANTDAWSAYGMAYDSDSDTLWINSAPNAGQLKQYAIDRVNATLTPTGLAFDRKNPGSAQGGLDIVAGGLDGRGCGYDLLGLDQGTPDDIVGYRVVLWDNYDPANEPKMLVGVDGGPLQEGSVEVLPSSTSFEVDVQTAGPIPNLPYILFFDASGGAPRPRGGLLGLNSLWEFTFPRLTGVQAGGFVSGIPLSINTVNQAWQNLAVGTDIEWQAMAFDLNVPVGPCGVQLPLMSTNLAQTQKRDPIPPFTARIVASGTNSFNSDTTAGFFSIEAGLIAGGDPIATVEFDWVNSTNPGQATMEFDTDQGGMVNAFWEGNGTSGCAGTYRNGSDVAVGLDYANAANNLLSTACLTSIAHCEATNQVGATPDYRTLKWYFTPGTFSVGTLEFDIDTDGGAGINGGAMDGMVVTITTLGGQVLTGQLVADPNDPLRSELIL